MAASCWRRKNSFCCLDRDSSTDAAIFLDTSEMEACLTNNSVASLRRSSGSDVHKNAMHGLHSVYRSSQMLDQCT